MKNFVCVCWGDKYPFEYVQKLYNMVQRNTTVEHKFIVFTDSVSMHGKLSPEIEIRKLFHHDYEGWWNKLQLFSPEADLVGENLDDFFNHGEEDTFSIINNFNLSTKIFNSSIFKWNNKTATDLIWHPWLADRGSLKRNHGDQDVVSKLVEKSPKLRIFPDEWSFSYKWHNRVNPRYSKSDWTFERGTGKVAVFHGAPNPHESDQEYIKNAWK